MNNKRSVMMLTLSCSMFFAVMTHARDTTQTINKNLIIDINPTRCLDQSQQMTKQQQTQTAVTDHAFPEPASGYRAGLQPQYASRYMAVANSPLATKAGCEVLAAGGSAIDAAIAIQAVLGLVEPQSSSIAGSAFMLYYDAKTQKVSSYDGRETAPAAATP